MIQGQTSDQITYEPPRKYTPKNIIYWESTSNELRISKNPYFARALLNKARKFLKNNRIEQIDHTVWLCHPIYGYNKTTHMIKSTIKDFECDCQGFKKKLRDYEKGVSSIKPICSHIIAIKQFCFIEVHNR